MDDSRKYVGMTGASGFVGRALVHSLMEKNQSILSFTRHHNEESSIAEYFLDLNDPSFDISNPLTRIHTLVHCAARAHVMNEDESDPLNVYLASNTYPTLRLAEQAAHSGVKRFIYISSIKALGESTTRRAALKHDSPLQPEDAYGVSKANAEIGLREIAERTGLEIVIIRPPLVYGPGVKANFASLMGLANRNLPLPLGSLKNRRSFVAINNLVDLIITCIQMPEAANQTFMVSDGADVSTSELLSAMTRAYGKKPRLLPFPPSILLLGARLLGKRAIADRLLGSLQVDIEHTKNTLGWKPKVKLETVLKEMARDSVV